jgi:glycosyltransferase involved in cell wall biosynthesis
MNKHLLRKTTGIFLTLVLVPTFILLALSSRFIRLDSDRPRIVWGTDPLMNNKYWARAMKQAGYKSVSISNDVFSMSEESDFDIVFRNSQKKSWGTFAKIIFLYRTIYIMCWSLLKFDIFVISGNGYIFHILNIVGLNYRFEKFLFRIGGKKIVVIPFGADSYVYRNIKLIELTHVLLWNYPKYGKQQNKIERRVRYWTKHADVFIPGCMTPEGFGRWDVLTPSALCIDASEWKESSRQSLADGSTDTVVVSHAPNHRGVKGTEFLINAIKNLQNEGIKVELLLIEGKSNLEVKRILENESDLHVDQLVLNGYGLNGLEAMASGLPVVLNLEDKSFNRIFRRWSFLNECPAVSSSPEEIVNDLRFLIRNPEIRLKLGAASRSYAKKYHDLDAFQFLFTSIIQFLKGEKSTLLDIYHPLTEFNLTKVNNSLSFLIENKIIIE